MNKSEIIKQYYNNPKFGLTSARQLHSKIALERNDISYADVKNTLKTRADQQVLKETKRPKVFNTIYASAPLFSVQIDILDMQQFQDGKYRYILCVVDVYSRLACCRAMRTRSGEEIHENILSIFTELKGIPRNINADNEFGRGEFKQWADNNKIKLWLSYPNEPHKNAIVERFNRTLREKLQKYRLSTGKNDWKNSLQDLIYNYNNSIHSTLKDTPYNVFLKVAKNPQLIKMVALKYKVGDKVRIKLPKILFEKGESIKTSPKIYIINAIIGNRYEVKEALTNTLMKEHYKEYQLIKVSKDTKIEDDETVKKAITRIRAQRKEQTQERRIRKELR